MTAAALPKPSRVGKMLADAYLVPFCTLPYLCRAATTIRASEHWFPALQVVLGMPPPGWACRSHLVPREGPVPSCVTQQDPGAYLPFLASSSQRERAVEPRPFLSTKLAPEGGRAERQLGQDTDTEVGLSISGGCLTPRLWHVQGPSSPSSSQMSTGRHCRPH